MMGHDDHGQMEAMDGWRIDWDIREMPHRIDVFNADGVPQYRISGDIPQRYLNREIGDFLRDHALQQLEMKL